MKTIPLTQGKFTLVDDEDYERLVAHKWYAQKTQRKNHVVWRALRNIRITPTKWATIAMHRVILKDIPEVDHKDGDGLNNTRSNLRAANHSENQANQPKRRGKTSQFKGVYWATWRSGNGKWAAQITHHYKCIGLGYFNSEVDAAKAYDRSVISLFGEYARPNFPDTLPIKS
jgi:HNH endonuclease